MSEKRIYSISYNGEINKIGSIDEFDDKNNGEYLWVDYYQPTREELELLHQPFNLHPLTIEDCTDDNLVPKLEEFPNYTFIILNALAFDSNSLIIDEVDFIIGKNHLITMSGYNSGGRKPLEGIFSIVEREIDHIKQGPAFLLHTIMDFITDKKFHAIDILEDNLDSSEDLLINDPSNFDTSLLIQLRRQLLSLRKSLFHEREILIKICRKDCPYISDKAIYHFRDISDHLSKYFELTETYRDIVTSLMELHMSMINNIMTKSANQTNFSVRRLTMISTIFMPLTLLAGIGGMSEWSMMTGTNNWKISYPLFLLGMVIIGMLNYWLIKRLERKENKL